MTKLYEANNHILIQTGSFQPVEHSHMAAHIIISMDHPVKLQCSGTEHLCHGFMLPSGVSHAIDTMGNNVLVFLYESTTRVAKQIQNISCISDEVCQEIIRMYTNCSCDPDSYYAFEKSVLNLLGITEAAATISDDRILSAMQYIRSQSSEKVTCQDVAAAVHLSQSRFSHLFREQVGMTFAAYLIYQRIMYVYTQMLLGKSITDAALDAGFSSSAHFADVNRRVFGISASTITHDLKFIKIQ